MFEDYGWTDDKTTAHDYILPRILEVFYKFNISKDFLILDAGCGGGYIIGQLFNKGYKHIYGFDLSESGINIAQNKYPEIKDRFKIHDSYNSILPFSTSKSSYDVVLSIEVVEHLYKPQIYLKNVYSWLKKDGYLILTTPYHGYLKNLALSLSNKWDNHFVVNWIGGHIKFFSKKTISLMLDKLGFKIVAFYGCGKIPMLWKSMVIVARK